MPRRMSPALLARVEALLWDDHDEHAKADGLQVAPRRPVAAPLPQPPHHHRPRRSRGPCRRRFRRTAYPWSVQRDRPHDDPHRLPRPSRSAPIPKARKLAADLGTVPSRNRLMAEFKIGADKARTLIAELTTRRTLPLPRSPA